MYTVCVERIIPICKDKKMTRKLFGVSDAGSGMEGYMRYKRKIMAFLLVVLASLCLAGCGTRGGDSTKGDGTQQSSPGINGENIDAEATILGVVKMIDSVQGSITIYDIENEIDMVFTYTGATDVRDSYDKMITMSQVELGEIVHGTYNYSNRKLTKLSISTEAWTYNSVDKMSIDQNKHIITIAKKLYQFDDRLVITDGERLIEAIDLNEQDELAIKGIDKFIYSIRVTKGHGYVRLKNYDAFVGGTIEVGYGIIVPVVEDMLIVAREGSYRVVIENGELQAEKNITLCRDEEVTLDLSDYKPIEERVGYVNFNISPIGADLYINGILMNYAEDIRLNYGDHVIRVSLTGYEDFAGILSIGESTSTVSISLAEITDDTSKSTSSSSGSSTSGSSGSVTHEDNDDSEDKASEGSGTTLEKEESSEGTQAMGTTEVDKDHKITIQGPEGAKVYLNGVYKGTAPLSFDKEIGTHTITLSQTGYVTKSYTVEVKDNGEDITFNFPAMVAE